MRGWWITLAAVTAVTGVAPAALAQAYPERPIRFVIPWPAGGSADAIGRLIATGLANELRATVFAENVAGATGAIGSQQVARAQPDGYTVLLASSSGNTVGPQLVKKPLFDAVRDFRPVGMVAVAPSILVVNAGSAYKSVRDIVEAAQRNPGKLSFGSGGNGNSGHLSGELFKSVARINAVHVPYKGNNPALMDLMGGQLDFMFDNGAIPLIKGGKVRALAVSSDTRLSAMPDLPTFGEIGLPGVSLATWFGLAVPAATPVPIVNRLNASLANVLKTPEVTRRLVDMGADSRVMSVEQFANFWRADFARYRDLIQSANITVE